MTTFAMMPYVNTAYRIRKWGRLPWRRGATLAIANHQHDLESMAVPMWMRWEGPWRDSTFALCSRRMYEPGYLAERLGWLAPLLRRFEASGLWFAEALAPIENELGARPLAGYAWSVRRKHGNLRVGEVFSDAALARAGLRDETLTDLLDGRVFMKGRTYVRTSDVREPYRTEIRAETRTQLDEDLAYIEDLMRRGATFYLTPEGRFTTDGRMGRFRTAYDRLSVLADVYLVPIAYDVFRSRRFTMLYRVFGPVPREGAHTVLAANKPVTVSQLLAEHFSTHAGPYALDETSAAIAARVGGLPSTLFVDPELQRDAAHSVRAAFAEMTRLGLLVRDGAAYRLSERRVHPQFPKVPDIVAYQAAFFAETLESARTLRNEA